METAIKLNLRLFDDVTNTTGSTGTGNELSHEMKTYYDKTLIDIAGSASGTRSFDQKRPIPKNGGKQSSLESTPPLSKALTPLTEGVTPEGTKLDVSIVTATVKQYGDYIRLSDMLLMTAIDNNLVEAMKLLGDQAGATLDTVTREVLNGGTNVQVRRGTDRIESHFNPEHETDRQGG